MVTQAFRPEQPQHFHRSQMWNQHHTTPVVLHLQSQQQKMPEEELEYVKKMSWDLEDQQRD